MSLQWLARQPAARRASILAKVFSLGPCDGTDTGDRVLEASTTVSSLGEERQSRMLHGLDQRHVLIKLHLECNFSQLWGHQIYFLEGN